MTGAAFAAALKPLLEARAGLTGVTVHLTEPKDPTHPMIVLIRARVTEEISWRAMGPRRTAEATMPGRVWTWADNMQDAADQALAIIGEIAAQVVGPPASPQVSEQTRQANVPLVEWLPIPADDGGWYCDAYFDLTYTSDLL